MYNISSNELYDTKRQIEFIQQYYKDNIVFYTWEDVDIYITIFKQMSYMLAPERLKQNGKKLTVNFITPYDTVRFNDFVSATIDESYVLTFLDTGKVSRRELDQTISSLMLLGFEELKTVELFVQQNQNDKQVYFKCLYDKNTRNALVFYYDDSRIGMRTLFSALIPMLCPWIFEEEPVTENEKAILKLAIAMHQKSDLFNTKNQFLEIWNNFAQQKKFENSYYQSVFNRFGTENYEEKLKRLDSDIADRNRDIARFKGCIRDCLNKIEQCRARQIFIKEKIHNGEAARNPLQELFCNNKSLRILKYENNFLYFSVTNYLNNINEQSYEDIIVQNKVGSELVEGFVANGDGEISLPILQRFWKEVFETQRFKIRVYCEFKLSDNANLEICNHLDSSGFYNKSVLNPHSVYRCFGGFEEILMEAISKVDLTATVYTAIQFTRNLNLCDRTVCAHFAELLKTNYNSKQFIEDENGNLYTMKEVIDILKKEM